jgi:hypothetical protein
MCALLVVCVMCALLVVCDLCALLVVCVMVAEVKNLKGIERLELRKL